MNINKKILLLFLLVFACLSFILVKPSKDIRNVVITNQKRDSLRPTPILSHNSREETLDSHKLVLDNSYFKIEGISEVHKDFMDMTNKLISDPSSVNDDLYIRNVLYCPLNIELIINDNDNMLYNSFLKYIQEHKYSDRTAESFVKEHIVFKFDLPNFNNLIDQANDNIFAAKKLGVFKNTPISLNHEDIKNFCLRNVVYMHLNRYFFTNFQRDILPKISEHKKIEIYNELFDKETFLILGIQNSETVYIAYEIVQNMKILDKYLKIKNYQSDKSDEKGFYEKMAFLTFMSGSENKYSEMFPYIEKEYLKIKSDLELGKSDIYSEPLSTISFDNMNNYYESNISIKNNEKRSN